MKLLWMNVAPRSENLLTWKSLIHHTCSAENSLFSKFLRSPSPSYMSVGEFNRKNDRSSHLLQGYSHLLLYSFRKPKLVDPVAMPIHLTHEYLARSNNNHCKGTPWQTRQASGPCRRSRDKPDKSSSSPPNLCH